MLPRIAAGVVVVGVVPAALWLAGLLPLPEARSDVVAYESRTTPEEQAWRDRVSAICGWERKQGRAFEKAFRHASSPADVQLLFKEAIRLGDEAKLVHREPARLPDMLPARRLDPRHQP